MRLDELFSPGGRGPPAATTSKAAAPRGAARAFPALALAWPLAAFLGGQMFTPLLAIAGLAAALTGGAAARGSGVPVWMWFFAGFLAYAALSSAWSPRPFRFVELDAGALSLAIRFEPLRVMLVVLPLVFLARAAGGLDRAPAARALRWFGAGLLVQAVCVILLTVFQPEALRLFAPLMSSPDEGVQNIGRNGLLLALGAPVAVHYAASGLAARPAIVAATMMAAGLAVLLHIQGGLAGAIAVAAALAAGIGVQLAPRNGFRVLGALLAAVIVLNPLVVGILSDTVDPALVADSAAWRLAIWERTAEVIAERPMTGAGLGALRELAESIPAGPLATQPLVPNHPHNAYMQVWAETGAVGAALLAAAAATAGWAAPTPQAMGRAASAAAAVAAAAAVIAGLSFDLWNDWWWAAVGIAGVYVRIALRAGGGSAPPAEGGGRPR